MADYLSPIYGGLKSLPVVGDVVKGVGGLFGGQGFTAEQQAYQKDLQAERAAYGTGANLDADRQRQLEWMQELQRRALGQGPSVAQMQLKAGLDQAVKNQMAVAAGARGPMVGLAQRNATIAGTNLAADANQQAAQLRAAEMLQAGNAMTQANTASRQQDIDYANALRQNILSSMNLGIEQQKTDNQMKGALIGGGAAVLAGLLSDERQKTDIAPASSEVQEMLDQLSPSRYRYKDDSLPGAAPGERVGIMAQHLERSRAGKALVSERPDGTKEVNATQAVGALLAAAADLHKRLKQLEAHA